MPLLIIKINKGGDFYLHPVVGISNHIYLFGFWLCILY